MDQTIELSDSSIEKTIVLDDSTEEKNRNRTIELESSVEEEQNGGGGGGSETEHFTTAASNSTKFLDATASSPPKITSTPKVTTSLFQEVEDEFLHDDSFAEEVVKKEDNEDSAIESEHVNKVSSSIE